MERVIVFGASIGGERGIRSLRRNQKAIAFCDNAPAKHGTLFRGMQVVAPETLKRMSFDRILVASAYYPEIFDQLVSLGIPMRQIEILDPDVLEGVDAGTSPHVGRLAIVLTVAVIILGLAARGLYSIVFW